MRDEELLELFRSDPESGAAALVEQYRYLLWGVCSRRLQDPEDAWECVYEALADFCLQWKRFSPKRGSVKSYLAAIADRRALDLYRKNQSWERARQAAARSGGAAEREGEAPLEDWLLGELAEKERVIVWLRCVRRMSYAEIARALRLPYEQTRKCGYRGLQKLRGRLERLAKE